MSKKDLARVRARISDVRSDLSDNADFQRFGASSRVDYSLARAEREGLKAELDKLEELEGYLKMKVTTEQAKA